jgi:hypothetical protein
MSVILRRDLPTIVVVDKQEVLHTVSVCVDLGIQLAMRMRLIVICGLTRSTIFSHIPLNGKIFEKKITEHNARVKPAKMRHVPHSSRLLCCVMYCLFCVVLCIVCV